MKKETFHNNLIKASSECHSFTKEIVTNHLPDNFRFVVNTNCSYDENIKEGEFTLSSKSETFGPLEIQQVIDLLWLDDAVPEWIDISIFDTDSDSTLFNLECCGRYSKEDKHLYHIAKGTPPYNITSPPYPPYFITEEEKYRAAKFDLHWKTKGNGIFARIKRFIVRKRSN